MENSKIAHLYLNNYKHKLNDIYIYIYGVAPKFGYGSAPSDPDVWIALDHLRFGMDGGYGSACGIRVWIGALHFDLQPYIYMICIKNKVM